MSPPSCRSPSPLIDQHQEAPSSKSRPRVSAETSKTEEQVPPDNVHHTQSKDSIRDRQRPLPKPAVASALAPPPAADPSSIAVEVTEIGSRFLSPLRLLINGLFAPLISSLRTLVSFSLWEKGGSDAKNSDSTTTTRRTPDIPTPLPPPHGQWTHPHKTLTDKIASAVVRRLLPLDRLAERCRDEGPATTPELVAEVRRAMLPDQLKSNDRSLERLKKERSWGSVALKLRRDPGLLVRWGVVEEVEPPWRRHTTKDSVGCDAMNHRCDHDGDHSYARTTECGQDERRRGESTSIGADESRVADGSKDHNHDTGEDDEDPGRNEGDSSVEVVLYGPCSILPAPLADMTYPLPADSTSKSLAPSVDLGPTNDGTSALRAMALRLEEFRGGSANYAENRARKLPIIIWFHGGGMMFGTSRDGRALDLARDLLARQDGVDGNDGIDTRSEVLLVGIEMGLAPERPFPWGLVDCLSVMESVLGSFPVGVGGCGGAEVHVAGESAGGNYASVVAMECHRRFPGRIKSAFIVQPMLVPDANSMSYYLNGPSSGFCPVPWLRWAWRVYLGIDGDGDDSSVDDDDDTKDHETTSQAHNDTSLKRWRRLHSPQVDLPPNLRIRDGDCATSRGGEPTSGGRGLTPIPAAVPITVPPRFIVVTSLADPLRDDGALLVNRLRGVGADVRHVESTGSHVIGPSMDGKAMDDAMDAWRDALFR